MNPEIKKNSIPLWEKRLVEGLLINLHLAPGTAEYKQYANALSSLHTKDHNPSGIPLYQPSYPSLEKQLKCSCCQTVFESREEQVLHYSLEWHRVNLKRSLDGLNSITQEQFSNGNFQNKNVAEKQPSSEDEDQSCDEEEIKIQRKPQVFFVNADEEVISIYRTVLHHKKANISSETELVNRAYSLPHKLHWTVLLIGGGHFAGAEFLGESIKNKKAFHNYTVRAKQGGTQSSKDNKNATSQPKSAGAALRRKNELAFNQNVMSLLEEWKDMLEKCNLIFFKCPKSSYHLLFGGHCTSLNFNDEKVRTIPFSTKRATIDEAKRVYDTLSRIYTHGKASEMPSETPKEKTSPAKKDSLSPSKRFSLKEKSKKLSKGELAELDTRQGGSSSSEASVERLTTSFERIATGDGMQPFEASVQEERYRRKKLRKKKQNEDCKSDGNQMKKVENYVYSASRTGNIVDLKAFHQLFEVRDYTDVSDCLPKQVINTVLFEENDCDWRSFKFGLRESTPLHVAAENGHKAVVSWMLDCGCDPCAKNKQNETPYLSTKLKEMRNHFRRYRADHPDLHDYEKASIPEPLTADKENQLKAKKEERKKQQKKAKREKEIEMKKEEDRKRKEQNEAKKREEEVKMKEEEEKQKFLQLSDREKRALAAEKRIAADKFSQNLERNILVRCFQCAQDVSKSKVYQYYDYNFCSGKCVSEHRKKAKS